MDIEFNKHVATHLPSQLALTRAKRTGDTVLYGMILSALEGTWKAAVKDMCKSCKEVDNVN